MISCVGTGVNSVPMSGNDVRALSQTLLGQPGMGLFVTLTQVGPAGYLSLAELEAFGAGTVAPSPPPPSPPTGMVHYCDITSPAVEPCCALTDRNAQGTCLQGKSINPIVSMGPSVMVTPACMSTCDMSAQPTCAQAQQMASSCAASCSGQEKSTLLLAATDQPCTGLGS
jgi:hypothetical protein